MWIVGGTEDPGWVESFHPTPDGSLVVSREKEFPIERDSTIGAAVDGRVYICGGSSGTFGNSVVHNECLTKLSNSKESGWEYAPSMPLNTSHAACAVHNKKIYVFGGYIKPLCGYKPKVQIFNHERQSWSAHPSVDPPRPFGGYGCAATYNNRIFVTGGYFTEEVYTTSCKEKESGDELTVSNRKIENYINYVQVYSPVSGIWRQGPTMQFARRNHGCAVVNFSGIKGLLVAGGYNSKQYFLKSVEFLPVDEIGAEWRSLPSLEHYRGSRLGILSTRSLIYAVSGDLEGNGTLIEALPVLGGAWSTLSKRLLREKSYATFITIN